MCVCFSLFASFFLRHCLLSLWLSASLSFCLSNYMNVLCIHCVYASLCLSLCFLDTLLSVCFLPCVVCILTVCVRTVVCMKYVYCLCVVCLSVSFSAWMSSSSRLVTLFQISWFVCLSIASCVLSIRLSTRSASWFACVSVHQLACLFVCCSTACLSLVSFFCCLWAVCLSVCLSVHWPTCQLQALLQTNPRSPLPLT